MVHIKIKNVYNVADMMTKPQDFSTIRNLMELMDHHHEEGRSVVAPDLNLIDDDNGLAFYIMNKLDIPCYHP